MYKWPAFFIGFVFIIVFGAAFSGAIGFNPAAKYNLPEASVSEKAPEKHLPLPEKKSLISSEVIAGEAVTEKSVDKIVSKLIDNSYVKKIDKKNMKPEGAVKRGEITSVKYSQTFKGLPVYGAKSIFVFKGNILKLAESNFFEKINLDAKPKLSAEDAAEKVFTDRQNSENFVSQRKSEDFSQSQTSMISTDYKNLQGKPELLVYPKQEKKGTQFYLAYKVDALLDEDMKAMTYFVDAKTGKVLDKFNRVFNDNTIDGKIYPYNPKNGSAIEKISYQYVSAESGRNNVFRSDGDPNGYAVLHTKNKFDLSGTDYAEVSILFKGDVIAPDSIKITSYNYGFPSHSGSYYASSHSPELGEINTIFRYLSGNTSFRIDYSTYGATQSGSIEIDNINITAHYYNGTVKSLLSDTADSGFSNFDNIGFYVANEPGVSKILTTNADGIYTGLSAGENVSATLSGPYFDLYNFGKVDSKYSSSQNFNWSWTSFDNSYKNEETNAFFHLNYARDFFDNFSLAPDEKILANLQFNLTGCSAFAVYPNGLYFSGPVDGCESTALGSDIIYHEYTHLITAPLLQYALLSSNQAGSMGEGLSDYFAATITKDPAIGENILNASDVRYLNNSLVYPNDFAGGIDCAPTDENDNCFSHDNSRIFSGALWDLRNNIGSDAADDLVTGAMLTSYLFYDFSDFVNRMVGYDYFYNDGLYKFEICGAFESHGISSTSCEKVHVAPTAPGTAPSNNNKGWMTVNLTSDAVLADCIVSVEETDMQADYLDDYTWTANITGFGEGDHSYIAYCLTEDDDVIQSYPRGLIKNADVRG